MTATGAVFVGNGSLLIQCAEAYRRAGHDVRTVVSHNRSILEWAETSGIAAIHIDADRHIKIPQLEFDYLFSIANPYILPAEALSRARKLAINFHDAPLPRYAGWNATCWALIGREKAHGVTWHEMTVDVDAGRIVRQLCFPIGPEETALSLNARCYEAGLASFISIVDDIGRGELVLEEQRGARSYFSPDRRPDALATLDFSRPADELVALARGLDFGRYPNPLALPKIYLGDTVLLARSARLADKASLAQPGTIVRIEGGSLQVASGDGDILIEGCCDFQGRASTHGLAQGMVLPAPDDALLKTLTSRIPKLAKAEAFWTKAFGSLAPVDLPYPRLTSSESQPRQLVTIRLDVAAGGSTTVAGFFAWLSALTGQEQVSALYCDAVLSEQSKELERWLTPWVPLTLATTPRTRVLQAQASAELEIAKNRRAGPYPRDLPLRLGENHSAIERVSHIAVCLGRAPVPDEVDLLLAIDSSGRGLQLTANAAVFARETIAAMADHLACYLEAFESASGDVAGIALLPKGEADTIAAINATALRCDMPACIHLAFSAQAARTPDHTAISYQDQRLSYRDLDRRASALASRLIERGVRPGDIVGLCLERTPDLVACMLAIMKAGAAYLPLDPAYPQERILFMIEDSATRLIITSAPIAASLAIPKAKTFTLDAADAGAQPAAVALSASSAESAAYVIYTSGSTGRPKGVVVSHGNVMNFFGGMERRVPHDSSGRWLAATSLSFDISVLELCWPLTLGFTVVLYSDKLQAKSKPVEFSLFYFASDDSSSSGDRYRLLLEGAKFADQAGFSAIWTPERHFHAFGGLYPNPAVTSAAIAAVTTRLKIRAGSCVLPLHHPIRVAEEWAFVDNISQGRVGISFAAGWQPNDFVIAPSAFANRKTDMLANIDIVRRLWRGEHVAFPGPFGKPVEVQTLPRPIQKELPVWVTAAGNPETFQQAGESGCHLLTHLLGQKIDDVAEKIRIYQAAWQQAGHPGQGHVTLMLHTFVGQDEQAVREIVRGPMKAYLRSSVDLIKQAAWTFPTFVQRGAHDGKSPLEIMDSQPLSDEEMDALLEHAFSRYYETSALFGTPQRCAALVSKLKDAGVDEIACLIDFGVGTKTVLAHLHDLKQLMDEVAAAPNAGKRVSVAEAIADNEVTHLQCTPSMASMLCADAPGRAALSRLAVLMVGGEALPLKLANELRGLVPGALLNMYGPTETTIWSSTCNLAGIGDFVPLGQPICNTSFAVRTPWGMECPALAAGELLIGGAGVAQGYWRRPELTAERFVSNAAEADSRLYRTGDLVRRHPGGDLEFLGRLDQQVKLRGHRIELGEIEAALMRHAGVKEAVVVARDDMPGDTRLIAYVTPRPGATPDPARLRDALALELPQIMVPAAVSVLAAFPMTPNGKVDRRALPEPLPPAAVRTGSPPQGDLEQVVCGVWQEVLGLTEVGVTDNFFDLGGHSLLVVQVQRRLRDVSGCEVSITDMFRLPTVRALAAHLGGNAPPTAIRDGRDRANTRRVLRQRHGSPQGTTV
jgi:natural product biosynthesis luciferase-like monooxygenase protein